MKRIVAVIWAIIALFGAVAYADGYFILCKPGSVVNARYYPSTRSEVVGRYDCGDYVETDGIRKNGFIHVGGFEGGGWVAAGFVTEYPVEIVTIQTEINANGRVACRRSIKGTRRKWLSNGQKVVIFAFADDWAITNQGFIQTRYLGVF